MVCKQSCARLLACLRRSTLTDGFRAINTASRDKARIQYRASTRMASWQRWREAQDSDPVLRQLVRERWAPLVERIDRVLLRPLAHSRIR